MRQQQQKKPNQEIDAPSRSITTRFKRAQALKEATSHTLKKATNRRPWRNAPQIQGTTTSKLGRNRMTSGITSYSPRPTHSNFPGGKTQRAPPSAKQRKNVPLNKCFKLNRGRAVVPRPSESSSRTFNFQPNNTPANQSGICNSTKAPKRYIPSLIMSRRFWS